MIIWVNGAFAAGKTTLAQELERRLPEAMPFDPEYVGYILSKWVPPAGSGDYQDIPLWRKLVADFAIGMSVLHVFLDVPAEELHRRIDAQVRGDQHTPAELADLVLKSAAAGGTAR
jgi:thymidylate kinase